MHCSLNTAFLKKKHANSWAPLLHVDLILTIDHIELFELHLWQPCSETDHPYRKYFIKMIEN